MINRGYRKPAVVLAFVEIMLWVFVASAVINGITEQPLKGIAYSFGFTAGVYIGSIIEERIAIGKILIQSITTVSSGVLISSSLREMGYGVTSVQAHGKDSEKTMLMIYTNRKGKEIIIKEINKIDPTSVIVSQDVTDIKGGFITKRNLMK